MKKMLVLIFSFLLNGIALHAQAVYELAFTFPLTNDAIAYKACFIDADDGKGKLRLLFTPPAGKDSILVDMDVIEEIPDISSSCFNSGRIYYRLQNAKYIECKDPGIILPRYFCFKTNPASGLMEPFGVTNTAADCKADVVKFNSVAFIEQKDLTKEFVLTYFKLYDMFYRNIFLPNNSKALTTQEPVKFFLLFVANVTDPIIGTADRKDMNDAITFFSKIKQFLNIEQFIVDTITGKRLNKQNVENAIKTFLTPGPNDIVVFYYSGHGFRKPKDTRPGPYIDLRDEHNTDYMVNSLSMEDIFTAIRKKGARLNLVLSDCCNTLVLGNNPMADQQPITKKAFGLNWSNENCRNLFLNLTPTSILGTASEPTQFAIRNKTYGGFFSNFFRNSIETHFSFLKTKVSWEQIFEQTKIQTSYKSDHTYCDNVKKTICPQKPYVNIMYGRF